MVGPGHAVGILHCQGNLLHLLDGAHDVRIEPLANWGKRGTQPGHARIQIICADKPYSRTYPARRNGDNQRSRSSARTRRLPRQRPSRDRIAKPSIVILHIHDLHAAVLRAERIVFVFEPGLAVTDGHEAGRRQLEMIDEVALDCVDSLFREFLVVG